MHFLPVHFSSLDIVKLMFHTFILPGINLILVVDLRFPAHGQSAKRHTVW